MKHFTISPLGLTPDDLPAVHEALDGMKSRGSDFVMHYWSHERRILILVQCEGGHVVDWMMMPCGTRDDIEELRAWWLEQVTDDVRERDEKAQAAAQGALDRVRDRLQ